MKIKAGYNGKEVQIRVSNVTDRLAELWIQFEQENPPKETLSYLTLEELMDLKDEIQKVVNKITGAEK